MQTLDIDSKFLPSYRLRAIEVNGANVSYREPSIVLGAFEIVNNSKSFVDLNQEINYKAVGIAKASTQPLLGLDIAEMLLPPGQYQLDRLMNTVGIAQYAPNNILQRDAVWKYDAGVLATANRAYLFRGKVPRRVNFVVYNNSNSIVATASIDFDTQGIQSSQYDEMADYVLAQIQALAVPEVTNLRSFNGVFSYSVSVGGWYINQTAQVYSTESVRRFIVVLEKI